MKRDNLKKILKNHKHNSETRKVSLEKKVKPCELSAAEIAAAKDAGKFTICKAGRKKPDAELRRRADRQSH